MRFGESKLPNGFWMLGTLFWILNCLYQTLIVIIIGGVRKLVCKSFDLSSRIFCHLTANYRSLTTSWFLLALYPSNDLKSPHAVSITERFIARELSNADDLWEIFRFSPHVFVPSSVDVTSPKALFRASSLPCKGDVWAYSTPRILITLEISSHCSAAG